MKPRHLKFRTLRGALIRGTRLIEEGAYSIFPKSCSDDRFLVIYVFVSPSDVFQKDPVFLKELHNIIPLAGLGLLQKVGWDLGLK